jgi:foldase protein PrsA
MTDKEKWDKNNEVEIEDNKVEDELQSDNLDYTEEQEFDQLDEQLQPTQPLVEKKPYNRATRAWMVTSLALLAILVYVTLQPPFNHANETVATVNGVQITKDKLYDAMVKDGGAPTLENMITEELMNQEADDAGIEVTESDIDNEIKIIKAGFPTDEEWQQALAQNRTTEEQLRSDIVSQILMRKLLEPQTSLTDEEIKQYYDENLEGMSTPEQVRASHILVATQEEADAIMVELKGGADFATIAKEKSIDPGSKDKGGDLNFFPRGMMEAPFEEAAFALEVGKLSAIVQTSHGFHIIKSTDKKAAVKPTLEEKMEEIRHRLIYQKVSQLAQPWIEELKAKAEIENTLAKE